MLLTGRPAFLPPFRKPIPPPIWDLRPDAPQELKTLFEPAFRVNPAERFSSIQEMAEVMWQLLSPRRMPGELIF
jgi:hypothetical protein